MLNKSSIKINLIFLIFLNFFFVYSQIAIGAVSPEWEARLKYRNISSAEDDREKATDVFELKVNGIFIESSWLDDIFKSVENHKSIEFIDTENLSEGDSNNHSWLIRDVAKYIENGKEVILVRPPCDAETIYQIRGVVANPIRGKFNKGDVVSFKYHVDGPWYNNICVGLQKIPAYEFNVGISVEAYLKCNDKGLCRPAAGNYFSFIPTEKFKEIKAEWKNKFIEYWPDKNDIP